MIVPATIGYWLRAETGRTKSQKFSCSVCGGIVFAAPVGQKHKRTVCDYPYCPYCLHDMRSSEEAEEKA